MQNIKTRRSSLCNVTKIVGRFVSDLIFSRPQKAGTRLAINQVERGDNIVNPPSKMSKVPDKDELKARLSPIQFQVTQLKATERPGTGEYNKFNKKGTYHCVVCDAELFKSDAKYESGCGWPAFHAAADEGRLKFVKDCSLVGSANLLLLASKADLVRVEVLCNNCNAHLGHKFDDGPISKGGKRYCINSASLSFKPAQQHDDDKGPTEMKQ